MDISIIVPIYNEAENIPILYQRLKKVVDDLQLTYEFIFVNDGSWDNSMSLLMSLAQQDNGVKYIDFSRNFGHQIAVTAGLDTALGKWVVMIDADLQDPPELIIDLYHKLQEGYDVVYAKRQKRKGESWLKRWTASLFYRLLSSITNINIPVDTGDFRIMSRRVVDVVKQMPEQHKFLRGQIAWVGFRQTFIEYERQERQAGETGYTYRKMIRFALDGITAFSDFPLKLVTLFGFVVSGIAFLVMLYALYSKFILQDFVQGWTSIMVSILFLGGIQLIGVGIIGEYISRMNHNTRRRPLYIVQETNVKKK